MHRSSSTMRLVMPCANLTVLQSELKPVGSLRLVQGILYVPQQESTCSTQVGTASLAGPYRPSLNCRALSEGSRLISQVRMPCTRASDTNPAAG